MPGVSDDITDDPHERAQLLSPLQSTLRLGLRRELARLKQAGISRAAMVRRKDRARARLGVAGGGTIRRGELVQLSTVVRTMTLGNVDDLERMGLDIHELLAAGDGRPSRAALARALLLACNELPDAGFDILARCGMHDSCGEAMGLVEIVILDDARKAVELELAADRPRRGELSESGEVEP
jgi:hypothetical protein